MERLRLRHLTVGNGGGASSGRGCLLQRWRAPCQLEACRQTAFSVRLSMPATSGRQWPLQVGAAGSALQLLGAAHPPQRRQPSNSDGALALRFEASRALQGACLGLGKPSSMDAPMQSGSSHFFHPSAAASSCAVSQ